MTREEAIEVVKARLDYHEQEKRLKMACEILIPELRESEDERIRKSLIRYVKVYGDGGDFTKEEYIAWLERQKEQKPSIFPPGLGEVHFNPISCEQKTQKPTSKVNGEPIPTENRSVNIPLVEWSEEDEINLQIVLGKLEGTTIFLEWDIEQRVIKWLKSLPNRLNLS